MRLASVALDGRVTWGIVDGHQFIDVGSASADRFPTLKRYLMAPDSGALAAAARSGVRYPVSVLTWLPVIPDPGKILCIGLNYESHRLETGRPVAEHPAVFTRFADSQLGHRADIVRPKVSQQLDYEGELAVVIGRPGRYIREHDAPNHIAGYACYNDATVRDWQRHTHQFTPGKNFPRTGSFGPCLVTPDEISNLTALTLRTRVNGETVQKATFDQLTFSIARLIEYCSSFTPLSPGDVIATGTPGGVGFKRSPPLWLKPGDLVEVEIDHVGLLSNGVADEAAT